MYNVRVGSEERDKRGTEFGVLLCKLERQGGEDKLEITAVLDASRAEKRGAQAIFREQPFRDRLCDCRLSCPSESIEPEDGGLLEVLGPALDLVQYALSGSLETAVPVPVSVSCSMRATATI